MVMPNPSLRDLESVVAIAEHGHFGCAVSQPALSTQVKKVEENLGVRLFESTPRSG